MTASETFFQDLPTASQFSAVTQAARYTPLPDDWLIVLTDVKGSTQAIRDGKYKNVNMLGAASIMGMLNIAGDIEIPYVFGGDGATLAIPPSLRDKAEETLRRLCLLAKETMNMDLRTGIIPVKELRARTVDVTILKLKIGDAVSLAMFSGGGLSLADRLLKDPAPDNPYLVDTNSDDNIPPDLEGLTCRWEPLQNRNGQILTLLISCPHPMPSEQARIYEIVLELLEDVLGQEKEEFRPTNNKNLIFRWPPRGLWMEAKLTAAGTGFLKKLYTIGWQSLVQLFLEKYGKKAGGYDAPVYRQELLANTDFQRFDDMIRMVVDCREDQVAEIKQLLDRLHQAGEIAYGVHLSSTALMTCLVFNLEDGEHLHFVDGSNGGFAYAAAGLKEQLVEMKVK